MLLICTCLLEYGRSLRHHCAIGRRHLGRALGRTSECRVRAAQTGLRMFGTRTCKIPISSTLALFNLVFTVLMAFGASAQQIGAVQPSAKPSAASAPVQPSAVPLLQQSLTRHVRDVTINGEAQRVGSLP